MPTATETREHPILFKGHLVRAILEGRKTVTRRVVKPQPPEGIEELCGPEVFTPAIIDRSGQFVAGKPHFGAYDRDGEWGCKCPYGQPGDRLWVRETWLHECDWCTDSKCGNREHIWWRATEPAPESFATPWKPSIHMPRWASRIDLEVTAVRVERIQEITTEQIIAEGYHSPLRGVQHAAAHLQRQFAESWDAINGPRGFGWEANPWVWVIEFKRVRP